MQKLFKVTATVTKVVSFPVEANTEQEAEAIVEQYLEDGEDGFEEFKQIESVEAEKAEESGDGDIVICQEGAAFEAYT